MIQRSDIKYTFLLANVHTLKLSEKNIVKSCFKNNDKERNTPQGHRQDP